MFDAVEVLLQIQNVGEWEYGSFSTYEGIKPFVARKIESCRGFNNIMVEYPYVECTDSIFRFRAYLFLPNITLQARIDSENYSLPFNIFLIHKITLMALGMDVGEFVILMSMFALEALHTVGLDYESSSAVKKDVIFLISKQLPDGGWSKSMKGCETHSMSMVKTLLLFNRLGL